MKANYFSPIIITSGTMEAVKWIALIAMTIDHANRFFFASAIYPFYCVGRLALPLFAFIFAYNLSRPDALSRGLYRKVLIRLFIFGLLATPGYIIMRHLPYIWPLNILFTLAVAAAVLYFYQINKGSRLIAFFIFLLGGLFVEYNWVGVIFCLAAWLYCKKPSLFALLIGLCAYILLDNQNGNHWALITLPLIFFAARINIKLPRVPYFFYVYYPLHLSIFAFLS